MDLITRSLGAAADILRKADKIPEYNQILEVQGKLLEQQNRIMELENENRELKEKINTKEDLVFKNDAYWTKQGDGPFCMTCHGVKGLLIRMVSWGQGRHKCNNCNNSVDTDPEVVQRIMLQQQAEAESRQNWY